MIDVRELRIGNWVENYKKETVFIDKFSNRESYFTHDGDCYSISKSNPIPITEEWLKKLGFTLPNAHYLIWYKEGFGAFRILFDVHLKHWQVGLSGGRVIRQVKYIHDLQNIYFALTEKELTLNDDK